MFRWVELNGTRTNFHIIDQTFWKITILWNSTKYPNECVLMVSIFGFSVSKDPGMVRVRFHNHITVTVNDRPKGWRNVFCIFFCTDKKSSRKCSQMVQHDQIDHGESRGMVHFCQWGHHYWEESTFMTLSVPWPILSSHLTKWPQYLDSVPQSTYKITFEFPKSNQTIMTL